MSEGEQLIGDGVTEGIVRIGDTVRRPLRAFSLTVQAYLAHLRDAGFTGAPLPFGVDEQGREMLSFVPGDVPRHPLPPETAGDDVLVALARLIRALHEASAGWVPPPDAVWGGTPANLGRRAAWTGLCSAMVLACPFRWAYCQARERTVRNRYGRLDSGLFFNGQRPILGLQTVAPMASHEDMCSGR
jgi:hypothetical protein